jgi:hypothetical protein
MAKKYELYTGNKTYMTPNGGLATPEIVAQRYPAVEAFPHVVETDEAGQMMWAIQNLSALRSLKGIDAALTAEEAITALTEALNAPMEAADDEPSAEERIAAALEYQNLLTMEDETA